MLGAAAVFGQVPGFLARQGWLEEAAAQDASLTRDTLNGLVAFVVPGPDPYSVAQGESTPEPGGIAAGATELLVQTADRFAASSSGSTSPGSAGIATMLNQVALQVNPGATGGGFPSQFARLSFDEKVEAFRRLEQQTEGSILRAISGTLIGITAFLAYSEGGVIDPEARQPTRRPVGWDLSRYDGVAEGRDELLGYWRDRRSSRTAPIYRWRRA